MNPKEVKYLHFTNEEEIEYKEAKHMLRNAIITLMIMVSLIVIVLVSCNNTELTTTQVRYKSVFFVLSAIVIVISLIAIIEKKKCIKEIQNKY